MVTTAASVTPRELAVLELIDSLAHCLPRRELHRDELISSVIELERQVACEPLSRAQLFTLQMHTWALTPGPLKPLLIRRVAELGRLLDESPD